MSEKAKEYCRAMKGEPTPTKKGLGSSACSRGWGVVVPARGGDKLDLSTIRTTRVSAIAEFLRHKSEPAGMLQPKEKLTWKRAMQRGCRAVRVSVHFSSENSPVQQPEGSAATDSSK